MTLTPSSRITLFILHTSFWVLYFTYRVYDIQAYLGLEKALTYVSLPMAFNLVASYVHYFFILPQWLNTKHHLPYFLKLVLLLTLIITLRIWAENHIFSALTTNDDYFKTIKLPRIISTVWDTLAFLIFTGMIRFTTNWFVLENTKKQLENEKLIAELNYLKAQINPHFLFNTLHNLNYLVYSGSKNATEVIIKLSNIMRYMIYDANKNLVPLQKEITYMHDYIALESIRLNESFQMDFNVHGSMADVQVAPLMLITFLENAFKHGVSDQEQDCWIKANLTLTDAQLEFLVSNRKLKKDIHKLKSGFGLENVKKRLQLIYPDQHLLDVHEDENIYEIKLLIKR